MKLILEKREHVGPGLQVLGIIAALAAAMAASAVLIAVAGASVAEGFLAMVKGAFGSWKAVSESLVKATPLILTGLATTVAFRAKVWNIGQEGQLYAGAMMAYLAYRIFTGLPLAWLAVVVLLAAFLGGALWGLIAAAIKAKYGVDVIISSIMLNYIVIYLLSWLLSGPWKDPATYYRQSALIAEADQFPAIIPETRLHIGFLIALLAAILIYLLIEKTPVGYEIRAYGQNPLALRFQGTGVLKILIFVMLVSGGLSGLAGAAEMFAVHHRLRADISLGYGYTGITIAMLAGLHPLAIIPAAIFFGGLITGSSNLQIVTNVPAAITYVIQAVVLLFLLAATAMVNYRIRIKRTQYA
jgi:simple sugar transport system permease protein